MICAAAKHAERVDRARRTDRPRRPPDGGVHRDGGLHDPRRARLDSRPGPDQGRDRGRPAGRRRDLDGEPRAARHAAPGGRRGHARGAGGRRGPARTGRRRQAVRGARREQGGPGRRAHPHLPPGGGLDDRPRRPRGPPAARMPDFTPHDETAARPVPDRARRPRAGARRDRVAWSPQRLPDALRRRSADRHPGLRPGLPRRARHRRHQHPPAPRAERARRAGDGRPAADRRQADALRPQPPRRSG